MAIFEPASPKQAMILGCQADVLVAGGAMGSGKSYILSMMPYFYIDDPQTRCIIIRKTRPQIVGAGGVWDTQKELIKKLPEKMRPKVKERDLEIVFPNGATIKYYPYQYDKDADTFQGLQPTFVGFDEGTQFSKYQIEYLFSRMRNNSKYKSRIVITCNPMPDSYLRELIDWYIDKDGYPDPSREGVIRYFIRKDGDYIWGNSKEELTHQYGEDCDPISFTFIGATITDNPPMMKNNPSYLAFLKGLDEVSKARYLYGNWDVRAASDSYFTRDWLQEAKEAPMNTRWCRAYDKAGTERTLENKSPDATVCIKMGRDYDDNYYIAGDYCADFYDDVEEVYGRICERVGARDLIIEKQAYYDGQDVTVVFPIDGAQAGKYEYVESSKKLTSQGFVVTSDKQVNNQSKLQKAQPFLSAAENGNIYILRNTFTEKTYNFIMKELEGFDGTRSTTHRHDDFWDAIASAYSHLSKSKRARAYAMPSNDILSTRLATSQVSDLGVI